MNNEWVAEERQSENAHRHPPTPKRLRLEALSAPGLGKETPSFLPLLLRTVREKGNASGCYWISLSMGTVLWWQWDLKQKNASELVGSGTGVRMSIGLKTITMTTITVLLLLCIELHFLYFVIFFKWQKFFIWDMILCIPGWPQTCYAVKGDLEFLILLLSPPGAAFRGLQHHVGLCCGRGQI